MQPQADDPIFSLFQQALIKAVNGRVHLLMLLTTLNMIVHINKDSAMPVVLTMTEFEHIGVTKRVGIHQCSVHMRKDITPG